MALRSGAPTRLRCEYLENPLGIDEQRPRLSWWLDDERPAELQTAYRILAASAPQLLEEDRGDLWTADAWNRPRRATCRTVARRSNLEIGSGGKFARSIATAKSRCGE